MDETRSKTIVRSGYIFILVNFLLAAFNLAVGVLSNSIAIASDAIHSLTDSVAGLLIIASEKLASHKKLSSHRQKIERITTIVIALIITAIGLEILVASIKNIFSPIDVDYSVPTIIVLVASIIAKYLLARFLKKKGDDVQSSVLTASSAETMNDTWISVAVLVSAVVYLIFSVDLSAYISGAISLVIIKVGLEFIFPHLSHHHHHHLERNSDHDH